MATKKKTSSSAGWPRKGTAYANWAKGLKALGSGEEELTKGLKGGLTLAGEVFAPGSLGRLDETTPENLAAIGGDLKWFSDNARNRSPEAQYALDSLRGVIEKAKTRSPEIQRLIDERTRGLSGLSNDVSIAAREMGQAGMNRNLSTALRSLRSRFPGAAGPAAAYGASPALAEFAAASSDLERQLIQDDYNARQAGLNSYENTVRGVQRDEMTDILDSTNAFRGYLTGLEDAEYNRQRGWMDAYSNFATGLDNRTNTLRMYNQGQNAAEKAGALGLVFGGGNLRSQTEAANRAYELGMKQLEMMKTPMMGGFGGSAGGGGTGFGGFQANVQDPNGGTTTTGTTGQTARTNTPVNTNTYGAARRNGYANSIFNFGG